jgi:hypothetical protein
MCLCGHTSTHCCSLLLSVAMVAAAHYCCHRYHNLFLPLLLLLPLRLLALPLLLLLHRARWSTRASPKLTTKSLVASECLEPPAGRASWLALRRALSRGLMPRDRACRWLFRLACVWPREQISFIPLHSPSTPPPPPPTHLRCVRQVCGPGGQPLRGAAVSQAGPQGGGAHHP